MGNCTCDFNKKYKTQNNYNPTLSNPNIIPNNGNQKINEFNKSSSSLPIPETEEVYKISRKRKTQNRIIKKQLKFNTVNSFTSYNSTLSKTKNTTTDVSDNKLSFKGANNHNYKFNLNSRIKTIYEKNSEYSDTLPSVSNNLNSENNSSQYDYNKKFIETKTKIRKKIHSKDKSLQIIPEEVNKINNQKLKIHLILSIRRIQCQKSCNDGNFFNYLIVFLMSGMISLNSAMRSSLLAPSLRMSRIVL